ncbi:adenosylmethionine decarboxylase [Ferrimonas balearica]|uniref:adenosylmethionine decarboxylase n=2 Tax=Ferrimonas balearica TaxID=44012 RepID=UPI001C5921D4|nr:adenosylmethionine decarboxylase [Ferrimonas balearica]MBW3139804.1 adenosylmethionine decarboxylase [Ferrimonas balearica]MBY6107090.1 adenosylmethionine decarboxylase [Ferrimonas balearica]
MMFFEGSEKKVEAVLKTGNNSLRALGKPFWETMVAQANATILSSVHNDDCDAYLLSESSLFVWDDRFLMLTCGTTTLVQAVTEFLKHFSQNELAMLTYQRKNEYQSHLQKSSFDEDLAALSQLLPGCAWRLGHLDGHHNYIFHSDAPYQPDANDATAELLMYHIQGPAAEYLRRNDQTVEGVRELFDWQGMLPDFQFDDFLFEPFGYSMNGIRGDRYVTVHVTPQEDSSYVSFESNLDQAELLPVLNQLLRRLNPQSYDLISFNLDAELDHDARAQRVDQALQDLAVGYRMRFAHYLVPPSQPLAAIQL